MGLTHLSCNFPAVRINSWLPKGILPMKNRSILATIVGALVSVSAGAQIQTIVTGTDPSNTNSAVITVSSNSYAIIDSVISIADPTLAMTVQGVPFASPVGIYGNKLIFTGPATIQVQGNSGGPSFATVEVDSLRKAVGTNIQTLVVSPANTNSAVINVSSNSYAVISSTLIETEANLLITMQGTSFTYPLELLGANLAFNGPASIQLQGDGSGPAFATVEVRPIRKSARTQFQTLVTGTEPSNTNSAVLNVPGNSYADIIAAGSTNGFPPISTEGNWPPKSVFNLQGQAFMSGFFGPAGYMFVGPATLQSQGNTNSPTFTTVALTKLAALPAGAQLQTLVTGTDPTNTNSAVITVSSNSYAVIDNALSDANFNVAFTVDGVPFSFGAVEYPVQGFTFAGPSTIQLQGDTNAPAFATLEVAPLRKAAGTNVQTLVVSPANADSATINVSSNSYAVISTAAYAPTNSAFASPIITMQGVSFTGAEGLTFAGPGTIQLQGGSFGPAFTTVEVIPIPKSARTQFQTLVVGTDPSNTNSAVLNIPTNSYVVINSIGGAGGNLVFNVQGVPLTYLSGYVGVSGLTLAGPATLQLQQPQGYEYIYPGFVTVAVTTPRK